MTIYTHTFTVLFLQTERNAEKVDSLPQGFPYSEPKSAAWLSINSTTGKISFTAQDYRNEDSEGRYRNFQCDILKEHSNYDVALQGVTLLHNMEFFGAIDDNADGVCDRFWSSSRAE